MSDFINHECGIAMIRLLKPLAYYNDRYGTPLYGFQKLFLLMEKQHNRGQDGVGIGSVKLNMPLGQPYMFRARSTAKDGLAEIFKGQMAQYGERVRTGAIDKADPGSVKNGFEFAGEILLGHLRYGTSGMFDIGACHPYVRRSNWPTKSLMVLGNFNMTNAAQLNKHLIERGQHPVFDTDTQTVLEEIGFHLDEEHTDIYRLMRDEAVPGADIPAIISQRLDLASIIRKSASIWDGGYAIAGAIGSGDAFALRDPHGIRPCFSYRNDELVAVASERVPLMTIFDAAADEIEEVAPGHVLTVKNTGEIESTRFAEECEPTPCSFERIYFSRGNDPEIYQERKSLGEALAPQILKAIDGDLGSAVLSFIPNTAEIAYQGVMKGLRERRRSEVKDAIMSASASGDLTEALVDDLILRNWPRGEKVAHKDIKMRTFISQENGRDQLVSHVYDITYGVVGPWDNLVVIDDSIVRGTTLRKSILKILTRTNPKTIIIASTAPQIRYPDCYGIDMSELGKFIAFQAAIALLNRDDKRRVIYDTYQRCREELTKPPEEMENCVKAIYADYSAGEISEKVAELVSPAETSWKGEVKVIYQTIEDLHEAIPKHRGDWYFTGNYPTPGGYAVVNRAFVHFHEERTGRAYDVLF